MCRVVLPGVRTRAPFEEGILHAWMGAGMHPKGAGAPPPPALPRAPSLCPGAVSLTANASFIGICNRQIPPPTAWQPPPTACLTASRAASEVPSLLLLPLMGGWVGCIGGEGGRVQKTAELQGQLLMPP